MDVYLPRGCNQDKGIDLWSAQSCLLPVFVKKFYQNIALSTCYELSMVTLML